MDPSLATTERTTPIPGCAKSSSSRRGRVLIVDDEPMVLRALQRWLSSAHDVTAMPSATDALDCVAAGADFDVILCDLTMPEMSGMQLHAELAGAFPAHAERMIFLSGGVLTQAVQAFLDGVTNPLLDKPVDGRALRELIARRIAGGSALGGC